MRAEPFEPIFSFVGSPNLDIIGIFKSKMPSETSLAQLEAASRRSNDKMLTLGDALMSGVHGWSRDSERACLCYRAAAWGCQEDEEPSRRGIPVGSPEAMVAYAQIIFYVIQKQIVHAEHWEMVATHTLISAALQSDRGVGMFYQLLYWLTKAARRGHVAPLTLEIARAISDMKLSRHRQILGDEDVEVMDDENVQAMMELLLAVHNYNKLAINFEKLQEDGFVPRGDPSEQVLGMFAAQCRSIFADMPTSSDTVHIEYRQIPLAPFSYTVYAIVPIRKQAIKMVKLPDYLQMCPFSEESFRYAWYRIAFELHLGNPVTKERKRPKCFTVLDSHGNRQFVEFLRNAISGSGSDVQIVSHNEPIRTGTGRRKKEIQLRSILQEVETRLLEIPNYLASERPLEQTIVFDVESSITRIANEIFMENETEQARFRATGIKDQGNQLFGSSDFTAATKCYSIAIEVLRLMSDSSNESRLLLGTTLSNRAACYLEMESQRSSVFPFKSCWFKMQSATAQVC